MYDEHPSRSVTRKSKGGKIIRVVSLCASESFAFVIRQRCFRSVGPDPGVKATGPRALGGDASGLAATGGGTSEA
jgi:hypothetical protein